MYKFDVLEDVDILLSIVLFIEISGSVMSIEGRV
jgi:hypothetical protein